MAVEVSVQAGGSRFRGADHEERREQRAGLVQVTGSVGAVRPLASALVSSPRVAPNPLPIPAQGPISSLPAGPALAVLGLVAAAVLAWRSGGLTVAAVAPAAVIGAFACARWPAAVVVSAFAVTGFANVLTAYLGVPPTGTTDLLLAGLWLGVLHGYLRQGRERELWLWPGLIAPGLYLALTFVMVFASDSTAAALDSFRLAGWHMAALFLIALAPWPDARLRRVARGFVAVALAVGLYAIYRKLTGPGGAELITHRGSLLRPQAGETFFFASFPTAQDLGGWTALLMPFSFALALTWRGRWRLLAALAAATCAFALLAADRRSAAVGAAVGIAIVVGLYVLAKRPFGAQRLAIGFLAVAGALAIGTGTYAATVGQSDETSARFSGLTNLEEDYTYQVRLSRWEDAAELASEQAFGHGLGTVGEIADSRTDTAPIAPLLDSSYLKIAVEQGWPMLVLFVGSLLWLAAALAWRAVHSRNPEHAAIAIGACGTIAVMLVLFYTSTFIERLSLVPGWLIVGLGAVCFTSRRGEPTSPGDPASP